MCYWDDGQCKQDFETDIIQLDITHEAYLPPRCGFPTAAPDPMRYTQCAGSGTYRVDIAFPNGTAAEACTPETPETPETPVVPAGDGNGGRRLTAQAPSPPPWTSRRAYPPAPAPVATLSAWVDASGYMYSSTLHAQNRSYAAFHPSVEVRGHSEFTTTDVAYVRHRVCGMLCMVDDRVGHNTVYHGYNECRAVSLAMEFFLDDDRC